MGWGWVGNPPYYVVYIGVDRNIITGQNEASTLTAVQNLILLCNARYGYPREGVLGLGMGRQSSNLPLLCGIHIGR